MHVDTYETVYDAAYQGAPGAYSEEAAYRLLGSHATLLPRRTLEQVFETVAVAGARHGVVPIENSLSGSVPNAYELLLSHEVSVIGETRIHIDHVLVGAPETKLENIRRVMSHPVALAQCGDFFRAHRHIQAVPVFDTAGAVEIVMRKNDSETAAIAARRAAKLYGAEILAEHLQDHPENWTRFLLLAPGTRAERPAHARRALVVFKVAHEPGALVRVLQPLADSGVNLTKIESRPLHGQPFEYQFILELTAPEASALDQLLPRLQAMTAWMKVLGTYPVPE